MTKASIDIGTNTVLLLIAKKKGNRRVGTVYENQKIPRLGKGVDRHRNLHPNSIDRVIKDLKDYRQVLDRNFPDVGTPEVTATSAVRDAGNRDEFIEQVYRETGYKVNVLSGEDEAEYTFAGALSVLPNMKGEVIVIDIGGGSTEIAFGKNYKLSDRHSFDIGSVRFTERLLKENPPTDYQVKKCRDTIQANLKKRQFPVSDKTTLIGVAGTVTSLAHIVTGGEDYDSEKLNGQTISFGQLQKWTDKIKGWSAAELLAKFPAVMKGRADVFLAGLLILESFMSLYSFEELMVSTGGIRHGSILRMKE